MRANQVHVFNRFVFALSLFVCFVVGPLYPGRPFLRWLDHQTLRWRVPQRGAGLVFVDAFAPEWQTAMTPQQWRIVQAITGPSKAQLAQYPAMERLDFDASVAQARAAAPPRPSLPVVVLSRDTRAHPMGPFIASLVAQGKLPAFVLADFGYINDRAWNKAQEALAKLVPNTQHIVVTGSDHNIQIDHPQAVTDAIHDVFDRAR